MTPLMLHHLVRDEFAQRADEGCDTSALQTVWEGIRDRPPEETVGALQALWSLLESLESSTADREPSTLEAIRALRPDGPRRMAVQTTTLPDRMRGALLGRIAGCQLGKPVEGWPRAQIDAYLAACGEEEIRDYLPYLAPAPDDLPRRITLRACCRGELHGATRDDDQDYTVLGLVLLDRHGAQVSSDHVADAWLELLPYHKTYTAERAAYRNLVNGLRPPASAVVENPYREWIGAQIRADGWGYACAGHPELAAELAYRDAVVSHVKNGIYGEMFFAAVIAAAFATDSVEEAIQAGLAEIPAECRLAECVHRMLDWRGVEPTWRGCWQRINERYGHYHPVHTINNAALVLLGLLYGDRDFSATIGIAVHGGWDTDCNGATAGSVLGAMLGAEALPPHWTAPLEGRVESALFGYAENRIDDLADLAVALWEKVTPAA